MRRCYSLNQLTKSVKKLRLSRRYCVSQYQYIEYFLLMQAKTCTVTVTNTVGEYRKLARIDHNPGEYHVYQDSPEPESIKAACMPGQDLYPLTVRLRIFIRPMACSVPLLVQGTSFCQSKTR